MIEFEITKLIPEQPVGWLEIKLPKSVMTKLQSYIKEAKKNPVNHNSNLAGNISESLLIKDKDNWFFQTVLLSLMNEYVKHYPLFHIKNAFLTEDAPYCLDNLWVNFQKENEFNPPHNHSGIFSFVIWVKIPTDWREQHAIPFVAQSVSPCASDFEFHYTTMLGTIGTHTYCLDKKSEGFMLFFPASLQHTVYPFYNCDKERISISGNIRLDTSASNF